MTREGSLCGRKKDADYGSSCIIHEDRLGESKLTRYGLAPSLFDGLAVKEHAQQVPTSPIRADENL